MDTLTKEELGQFGTSGSFADARAFASFLSSDLTAGGIFPNGETGDFSNANLTLFKAKYCRIWPFIKTALKLAKLFTNERVDKVVDALIELGDANCG